MTKIFKTIGMLTIALTYSLTFASNAVKASTKITILTSSLNLITDSIYVKYYDNAFLGNVLSNVPSIDTALKIVDGKSEIILTSREIGYFSIFLKTSDANSYSLFKDVISLCPIENGNDITIIISQNVINKHFNFEAIGNGAINLECFKDLNNIHNKRHGLPLLSKKDGFYYYNENNHIDNLYFDLENLLKNYKDKLSIPAYQLFLTDIQSETAVEKINTFFYEIKKTDNHSKDTLLSLYKKHIQENTSYPTRNKYSKSQPVFIISDLFVKNYISDNESAYLNTYREILQQSDSLLKDKLIANFFYLYVNQLKNMDSLIHDALTKVNLKEVKQILSKYSRLADGAKAYNFSLTNIFGKTVQLTDFKGKIVFIDFWFTGCAPCRLFYQNQLKDVEELYKANNNIVFITISIDKNFELWKKSVASGDYTSNDVINLYTSNLGKEHPIISYYGIKSYPHPMLIDKNGNLFRTNSFSEIREKDLLIKTIEQLLKSDFK
ncbi:TlpA disulfide reductase family protein [Pedobacter sp. Du54]|uniref:TlpA family protein disulfide reductase n=1 Tax=Pedobacter anseongensis TaxID=3133439 RepID=UPI0030B18DB8